MFGERVEDILVDHVASGVVEPGTFFRFLNICHQWQFHVDTRNMPEHLLKFDLLGMHEKRVGDLSRADLLALAAVHAGVRDVGVPDKVEHEIGRKLTGGHICRV